jgi:hypothetical protein
MCGVSGLERYGRPKIYGIHQGNHKGFPEKVPEISRHSKAPRKLRFMYEKLEKFENQLI